MPEPKQTKSQAKEAARLKAAEMREQNRKRARRNRIVLFSSIGVVVLAIVAIVAVIVASGVKTSQLNALAINGPKNMASGGLVLTSTKSVETTKASKSIVPTKDRTDRVRVQIVLDLQCPYCKQFEQQNGTYIEGLLNSGKITYETFPVAFLTEYSARAGNAVLCVANSEPEHYYEYLKTLYANQPEETNPGSVTNAMLTKFAKDSGVTSADTLGCIRSGTRYDTWLKQSTSRIGDKGISGTDVAAVDSTPTVIVDGKRISDQAVGTPALFKATVDAAIEAKKIK